jgi:hypothetical protein
MGKLTSTRPEWQSERQFLVGRQSRWTRAWMGGCPYAQTCQAWSDLYNAEVIMLLPCKRWGCEHCGVVRAADLSRRIVEAAPTKFITLTVANSLFDSPRHAYDETRRRLPKWSAKIRKKLGSFEFCRVLEMTSQGWPHYHLLARCRYIPQETISEFWAGLTGSPIVDIRAIRHGQNSVNYVCKYLKKQAYCPFTSRRVSWSRNFFPKTEKPPKDSWKLRLKEHKREHPADVIQDEWGSVLIHRIGPYAWTNREPSEQVDLGANEPRDQLVP